MEKGQQAKCFAANYDDFVNKFHTIQMGIAGTKLTDNLMGWVPDETTCEAVLFIDADLELDNRPFAKAIISRYKAAYFFSQSTDGNVFKCAVALPLYFESNADLMLFNGFEGVRKPCLKRLLHTFGIDAENAVKNDVLKTRQGRYMYRCAYNPNLYAYPNKPQLCVSHDQLMQIIRDFEDETKKPVNKKMVQFIAPTITPVNWGDVKPTTIQHNGNIWNFENLFDTEKYTLDSSNHTLAYLFTAMSGIIDNNVLYNALRELLIERNSTRIDEHLQHFQSNLIEAPVIRNKTELNIYQYVREILPQLDFSRNFLLKSPTGSGKSNVAYYLRDTFGLKILAITPRVELRDQWEGNGIDSICYQSLLYKGIEAKYDCVIFDEQHTLYEFFHIQDYKKFLANSWLPFNKLKICLSATPDYRAMAELFPEGDYNVYDVKMQCKERVVQIIMEEDESKIIKAIIRNERRKIWGVRNYIIFCDDVKNIISVAGQLRRQLPDLKVFEYYTHKNSVDEERQKTEFKYFKYMFEREYGRCLIMTRKGSVGVNIDTSVDVMQITLTADNDTQIQQFNRRCRQNVREIIIHCREKLSDNQKKWFVKRWDKTCARLCAGTSIADLYVKRGIGIEKYTNCILAHNPKSNAFLYCGGIFLKIANLHENFEFDNIFSSLDDFEGFCVKYPEHQAYDYDCAVRRLNYSYKIQRECNYRPETFYFTTNGFDYEYNYTNLVQLRTFDGVDKYWQLIEYAHATKKYKNTRLLRNELYSLATFFNGGDALTAEEIVQIPFLGAKWKDGTIILPKETNYLNTANKWIMTEKKVTETSEQYGVIEKKIKELVYVEQHNDHKPHKPHKEHKRQDRIWIAPNGEERTKSEWMALFNINTKYPEQNLRRNGFKPKT